MQRSSIGWRYESARHALAARGIHTGRRYDADVRGIGWLAGSLAGRGVSRASVQPFMRLVSPGIVTGVQKVYRFSPLSLLSREGALPAPPVKLDVSWTKTMPTPISKVNTPLLVPTETRVIVPSPSSVKVANTIPEYVPSWTGGVRGIGTWQPSWTGGLRRSADLSKGSWTGGSFGKTMPRVFVEDGLVKQQSWTGGIKVVKPYTPNAAFTVIKPRGW